MNSLSHSEWGFIYDFGVILRKYLKSTVEKFVLWEKTNREEDLTLAAQ